MTTAPLPSASSRSPSAAAPPCSPSPTARNRLLGRLLGGLALAHAALGLAVGEDLAEVSPHGRSVHPPLVPAAQPLLGRRREREHVRPARAADQLHLALLGSDRQHDRLERGVQVGADAGGHGGALARVGVERLEPGARARVELADVLVDGLDVRAVFVNRAG